MNNEIDHELKLRLAFIAILHIITVFMIICSYKCLASSDTQLHMIRESDCIKADPAIIKIRELFDSKPWIRYDNEERKKLEKMIIDHPELKINLV